MGLKCTPKKLPDSTRCRSQVFTKTIPRFTVVQKDWSNMPRSHA